MLDALEYDKNILVTSLVLKISCLIQYTLSVILISIPLCFVLTTYNIRG